VDSSFQNDRPQTVIDYLTEARRNAELGDEPKARCSLESLRTLPYREGLTLSDDVRLEIEEIRKIANRKAFHVNIQEAAVFASAGEVGRMEGRLAEARDNAKIAGFTPSAEDEVRIAEIKKEGHTQGIRVRMIDAVEDSRTGHVAGVEACIRAIHTHARVAEVTITPEVLSELNTLVMSARKVAITNVLAEAQRLVEGGAFYKGSQYLSLAGWHAQEAKIAFDEQQEARYLAVLELLIRGNAR
jgi:hypothetical protein